MILRNLILSGGLGALVAGCAGLEFYDKPTTGALTYYDQTAYLMVDTLPDCTKKSSILTVPGQARSVAFRSGYGSADLSIAMSNGMITNVGQKTDTKIPETISALSGAVKDVAGVAGLRAGSAGCKASSVLYPVVNGRIVKDDPI